MILAPSECRPDLLETMLRGQLPVKQMQRVEHHLCTCKKCQSHLEQLAGGKDWWTTTETALRDVAGEIDSEMDSKTASETDQADSVGSYQSFTQFSP